MKRGFLRNSKNAAIAGWIGLTLLIDEAVAQVTVSPFGGSSEGLGGFGQAAEYTYGEIVGITGVVGAAVFAAYALAIKVWGLPKQGLTWIVGLVVMIGIAKPFMDGLIGALGN